MAQNEIREQPWYDYLSMNFEMPNLVITRVMSLPSSTLACDFKHRSYKRAPNSSLFTHLPGALFLSLHRQRRAFSLTILYYGINYTLLSHDALIRKHLPSPRPLGNRCSFPTRRGTLPKLTCYARICLTVVCCLAGPSKPPRWLGRCYQRR